ncbi:MAG: leucine-rich repeat domain-containing protein [Anaerobutyricum sp.]
MPETVILDSKEKCTWSKVSRTICGIVSDNTKNLISEIPRYKSVDGILYSSDMKTLCFCPGGKTGHVTIPEGVTKIKDMAFYSSEIHSVKLPDTLQDIGSQAFQLCHNLTHIDFGNGIRRLGANGHCQIFDVCNSLESVEFPAQIEYIGHNCFENCKKLRNVKFNEGLQEIGPEAFMDCESLKNVEFPSTLKKVGKRSFTATDGVKWLKLKIIPFGFVHAFISNAGPCGQRYMDVDYNGKHFAIPKRMDTCRLSECVQRFESECISWCGLTDDFLDSLYLYSRSKIEKHLCAMVAYKYTRKEQIKKDIYGRCNTSTVHGITEPERVLLALDEKDLSEKEFVDCLNTGFVDARPELIDEVKKKGWNIAVAYILDKSKEPEKVNLSL